MSINILSKHFEGKSIDSIKHYKKVAYYVSFLLKVILYDTEKQAVLYIFDFGIISSVYNIQCNKRVAVAYSYGRIDNFNIKNAENRPIIDNEMTSASAI